MPTYDFVNTNTGEEFEEFMSMAAREQYLKDNPHIQQMLGAKTSAVANAHGRKSMKEIKTQNLVNKHIGKFGH